MMTYAALHWIDENVDSVRFWSFAVNHAAWIYNHLPNKNLFTKTQSDHRYLLRTRVWVCPVFVIHTKLQYNQKIPKFNRWSRMGQLLGFSDEHNTLVTRVRNLATNFLSPQFHVVFDDKFSTIQNDTRLDYTAVEVIFNYLFTNSCGFYGEEVRPTKAISDR